MNKPKVIAIVGPTASGKTSLAIAVAETFAGEVVSCDSRQVYKGLDIGSGKVTKEEMRDIPHHLLDVANVTEAYTANDFKRDAAIAVNDIISRDRVPIIAGGTFFYLDQLRYPSLPAVPPNQELRAELETLDTAELFSNLVAKDPRRAADIDKHNRRRLIRALEICAAVGSVPELTPQDSPYDWLLIGIAIPQAALDERIRVRLIERIDAGMIEEVKRLLETVPAERLKELGLEYRYITEYIKGNLTKEALVNTLETKIRQFSRRQMTWLKRDTAIEWFSLEQKDEIFDRVKEFISP